MSYTRLLRLHLLGFLVVVGCGGSASNPPPPENSTYTPPPKKELPPYEVPDSGATRVDAPVKADGPEVTAKENGGACQSDSDCRSRTCTDGICCNTTCDSICHSCKVPGSEGTCSAQPAGTQCGAATCVGSIDTPARTCNASGVCLTVTPRTCPTACANNTCNDMCSADAPCQGNFFCDGGHCKAKRITGTACGAGDECASGFCADGVCCNTECKQSCFACNLPSSSGTCSAVPSGQDPRQECTAQAATTCGRAGGCDGGGLCRFQPPGTPCGTRTCTNAVESSGGTCSGTGMCVLGGGDTRACSPFRCGGTSCRTRCTSTGDCDVGFTCRNGVCGDGNVPPPPADVTLYWPFDEPAGSNQAEDASGNNHLGNYTGNGGSQPTRSTNVPSIGMDNQSSRAFNRGNRQAVRIQNMPSDLMPGNDMTVAAWYRATNLDNNGADVVSGGNSYILRLSPTRVEFIKRVGNQFVTCSANVAGELDSRWHHIAGVSTPAGMELYFDGVRRCNNTQGGDINYDQSNDFWVGRHGNGDTNFDFGGNIDDVRLYGRPLAADEILALVTATPQQDVALQWSFDEDNGSTTATDASGGGYDGTYTGNGGSTPTSSTNVPTLDVDNPASRAFNRGNRQAVRLQNFPQALRPTNSLTIAAWYRATTIDTQGAELISGGNSYVLRLHDNNQIEFAKRITNAAGNGAFVRCTATLGGGLNPLDGAWHHVAGVASPAGMVVYFDGVERCRNQEASDLRYDLGPDLWVGRHGDNDANYDFQGNIDEVRIFTRELSGSEVAAMAGPTRTGSLLYWRLDEANGGNANDSSPSNFDGAYTGTNGAPTASGQVPFMQFPDPRSRAFNRTNRHAVRLAPMPQALQPANDLTVSVWYKATTTDTQGSELVSGGNSYVLRLRTTQIEFSKRIAGGAFSQCLGDINGHLDGQWHHVAGVTSAQGLAVYFDGMEICNQALGGDIVYDQGPDFWVGRHGNGSANWDFEGNIDDVRVEGRALLPEEIQALAQGGQ